MMEMNRKKVKKKKNYATHDAIVKSYLSGKIEKIWQIFVAYLF